MTAAADYNNPTTVTLQQQINCQQSLTDMLSQQQRQQQMLTKSDIIADGQMLPPADMIVSYVETGSGDVGLSPRNVTSPIIDL